MYKHHKLFDYFHNSHVVITVNSCFQDHSMGHRPTCNKIAYWVNIINNSAIRQSHRRTQNISSTVLCELVINKM